MSKSNGSRVSGTKEWSTVSVNCVTGCEHDCRYCYARAMGKRYGRTTDNQWPQMIVRQHDVTRRRRLESGRVMFPTTHDITPSVLKPCLTVIGNLLDAGNEVLIVSKPHISCVERLCREFRAARSQVVFRFTVGSINDSILGYWEPGAPCFDERLACLRHAFSVGFTTSVSAEPLLEVDRVVDLFEAVEPFVTDTVWFGKMNQLRNRVVPGTSEAEIERIECGQADDQVKAVYGQLKDEPKVRWKESYKTAIGLELAEKAGLDV